MYFATNHKVKPNIKYENNVMQKADSQGAIVLR